MRPARKEPKVRLNLDMHHEVKARLERVRDSIKADSMGEVVRRATAVYDHLLQEQLAGSTIVIRSADGSEKGLPLF
jgi:hypothetical protein